VVAEVYYEYLNYFLGPVVYAFGPFIFLSVFAILTYRNIRSLRRVNPVTTINNTNLAAATNIVPKTSGAPNNDDSIYVTIDQRQKQKKITTDKQRIDGQFSTVLII
jgi:hypothetical protein